MAKLDQETLHKPLVKNGFLEEGSSSAPTAVAAVVETASPAASNSNPNNANQTSTRNDNRYRQTSRPTNHRRDKEKDLRKEKIDPNLPQLVQEIQDKLVKSTVECMICYDMVRRSGPIWSCSSCYSILHLNCIKKWTRAPTSVDLVAEKNQGFNWHCPGCQSVQFTSSKKKPMCLILVFEI